MALATLLRRFPTITLACAPEDLTWRPGGPSIIRGLEALPIRTSQTTTNPGNPPTC
ncbi:hypothetical protein ACIBH1_15155 [Nonomuraea sp. NPDC050663]|uniref:hypothetical protein n=1 Tax=Nonomuraea sp. NPDC050663 TaxID=3364370 RepID=UPI0037A0FC09